MITVPFGSRPKTGIEKIVVDDMTLYMEKKRSLSPNEQPPAMQELEAINQELQQLLLLIAEAIQRDYPVDIGYAYYKAATMRRLSRDGGKTVHQVTAEKAIAAGKTTLKISEGSVPLSMNDWLKFPGVDATVIINKVIEGEDRTYEIIPIGQAIAKGTTGTRVDLKITDYASDADIQRITELGKKAPEVAIQATTLFMQNRVLFPVEGVEAVKAGAEFIRVPQLNIDLQIGDRLKFAGTNGNRTVIVKTTDAYGPSDDEEDYIDIKIEKAPGAIASGTTGYLMQGNRLATGIRDWEEPNTKDLPEAVISEVFRFHQSENKPPSSDDDGEGKEPGNDETRSPNSEPSGQLTGANTIGESKATESATSDSTQKTLAAVPAA